MSVDTEAGASRMVEPTDAADRIATAVLAIGIVISLLPFYLMVTAATSSTERLSNGFPWWPGDRLIENLAWVWSHTPIAAQLLNSVVIAGLVTAGATLLAFCTATALVYFDSRFKTLIFGAVMATLMLPLEVRIVPTYAVAANLLSPLQALLDALHLTPLIDRAFGAPVRLQVNLLDSYAGLSLPLLSSATGTFMFRQFLLSLPRSLAEAARMDGAGPLRFMVDILAPLARPTFAALAVLTFLSAWNQYLWPLLASTDGSRLPAVAGLNALQVGPDSSDIPRYHHHMAAALLVVMPPLAVVAISQRWMRRGLELSEK